MSSQTVDLASLRSLLARRLPSACLVALGGLLCFAPLLEGGTTHQAVLVTRLIILLLVGLTAWGVLREGRLNRNGAGLGGPILVFLGLAAVSTLRSPYTHQSLQTLLVLLSYAGLLYSVVFITARWDHIHRLVALVIGMAIGESGYALAQAWLFGEARPTGTFFNPNFLAAYLGAIGLVLAGGLCYARLPWRRGRGARPAAGRESRTAWRSGRGLLWVAAALTAALLLAGLLVTGSRGAVLAVTAGLGCVLWMRFGVRGAAAMLALVLCALFVVPNPVLERAKAEQDRNPVSLARWAMWQQAVSASGDHPLGVGLGLYRYVSPRYPVEAEELVARYGHVARTPHNEYLQMAVESGVLAPIVFLWGVVVVMKQAAVVLRRRLSRMHRGMLAGLVGGIVALLVHAGLDSVFHVPALAMLLVFYVGLVLAMGRLTARAPEPSLALAPRSRWVWAGVTGLVVAVLTTIVLKLGFAWMAYEAGARARAQHDLSTAMARFQRAVDLDPGKALYHSALAAAHFRAFEIGGGETSAQAALRHLRTAVMLNPIDGRLYAILGDVFRRLHAGLPADRAQENQTLLRAALDAYHRASLLEPYSPFHHLARGQVHLALGESDEAMAAVQHAVAIEPNFLPGRAVLAEMHLRSGNVESAHRERQEIAARQTRYATWPKDAYEASLLNVNVTGLARPFQARHQG